MTTTTSVSEKTARNTPEPGAQTKVSPVGKDGLPAGQTVSSETPKYTEAQLELAVRAAKSEAGREKKTLEAENATLKTQLQNKESELADNAADIEKLDEKLKNLASDDPEKFKVIEELKAAREERKQLKADRQTLEAEKSTHAESKAEVEKWQRDQLVYTVADEFTTLAGEAVDFDSFMAAADKFKLSEREGLVALAETMGLKPKVEAEPGVAPVKPYSGVTTGGSGFRRDPKNPDATIAEGFRKLKK